MLRCLGGAVTDERGRGNGVSARRRIEGRLVEGEKALKGGRYMVCPIQLFLIVMLNSLAIS
jgi:hypothetical protein